MTQGIDTGVAATRDIGLAAGILPGGIVACAKSDFNPSVGSSKTSISKCTGATVLEVRGVDQP